MEAINYRKPIANVFPHEIMFVGLIVSMQDLGFMIYKIICCCFAPFFRSVHTKENKNSWVHEDGKDIFQD